MKYYCLSITEHIAGKIICIKAESEKFAKEIFEDTFNDSPAYIFPQKPCNYTVYSERKALRKIAKAKKVKKSFISW